MYARDRCLIITESRHVLTLSNGILIPIYMFTDVQNHDHQLGDLMGKLVAPSEPGSARYTQWVSSLKRPVAKIRDSNLKQVVFACVIHLKVRTRISKYSMELF